MQFNSLLVTAKFNMSALVKLEFLDLCFCYILLFNFIYHFTTEYTEFYHFISKYTKKKNLLFSFITETWG